MGNACCSVSNQPEVKVLPESPPKTESPLTAKHILTLENDSSPTTAGSPFNKQNTHSMSISVDILPSPIYTKQIPKVMVVDAKGENVRDINGSNMIRMCEITDSPLYPKMMDEYELVPLTLLQQSDEEVAMIVRDQNNEPVLHFIQIDEFCTASLLRYRFSMYVLGPGFLPVLDSKGNLIIKMNANSYICCAESNTKFHSETYSLKSALRKLNTPYDKELLLSLLTRYSERSLLVPKPVMMVTEEDGSHTMKLDGSPLYIHPSEEVVRTPDGCPVFDSLSCPLVRCIRKGGKRRIKQKLEKRTHVLVPFRISSGIVHDDGGEPILILSPVTKFTEEKVEQMMNSKYVLDEEGNPVKDDQNKEVLKEEAAGLVVKNNEERDSDTEAELVLGMDAKGRLTPQHNLAKRWRYPLYRKPTQQIVPWLEPSGEVSLDKDGYPMMGFLEKEEMKEFWDIRSKSGFVLGPNGRALKAQDGTRIRKDMAIVIKEESDEFLFVIESHWCSEAIQLVKSDAFSDNSKRSRLEELIHLLGGEEFADFEEVESVSGSTASVEQVSD